MQPALLLVLLGPVAALPPATGSNYLELPAAAKQARVWALCVADPDPAGWFGKLRTAGILFQDMCATLSTPGDELPAGRNKFIHTVGVVGRARWRSLPGHNYTGLFQGAQHGVVRLSLAKQGDSDTKKSIPGIGIKFLRDGRDSANTVAMHSVDGQDSWNFFKNVFSNHVPKTGFSFMPVAIKFATATKNIRQVGLSDWARYGEDGAEVLEPVFPYKLLLQPNPELQQPDAYVRPHTEMLAAVPANSKLYTVRALSGPPELGGREQAIAELVLDGELVTSGWGDRHLLFRHQDMADDLLLRPEWNHHTPKFEWGDEPSPPRKSKCGA